MRAFELANLGKPIEESLDETIRKSRKFHKKDIGRFVTSLVLGTGYIGFVFLLFGLLAPVSYDGMSETAKNIFLGLFIIPIAPFLLYIWITTFIVSSLGILLPDLLTNLLRILTNLSYPLIYCVYVYLLFTGINYIQFKRENN